MLDVLPATIHAMSEPMVSHDVVAFYLLSEVVSKHVKVVQSGQGADEVFAGYHWYQTLSANDPGDGLGVDEYGKVFFDRDDDEIAEVVQPATSPSRRSDPGVRGAALRRAAGARRQLVERALRIDTEVMLVEDPVKRVDNMTMAWGLEARVPFLDHELVELAFALPDARSRLAGGGKGVLKDIARRLLPHEVIDRPKGYVPRPAPDPPPRALRGPARRRSDQPGCKRSRTVPP